MVVVKVGFKPAFSNSKSDTLVRVSQTKTKRQMGWRVAYYGSGIIALIIGFLTFTTLKEPQRIVIGEEHEEGTGTGQEAAKTKDSAWKVMLQPRFVMLCIAASIRHTVNSSTPHVHDLPSLSLQLINNPPGAVKLDDLQGPDYDET
ncbi:hypothetical protein J6590_029288 [Homalodisca vitripennis]|nr:hypothetical protein J6590_029288 [Homalodisca vitripennis]